MTQELKDKWLEALESGEYKQGFTALITQHSNHTSHCCLGVLGVICGIPISEHGGNFLDEKGDSQSYENALNGILTDSQIDKLWRTNDRNLCDNQAKDYSNVIPLIKELPVSN